MKNAALNFLFGGLLVFWGSARAYGALDIDKDNWSAKYKGAGETLNLPLPPRMDRYEWDRLKETKIGSDVFIEFFYWEPGLGSRTLTDVRVWVVYQVKGNEIAEVVQEDAGVREFDPKQPFKTKSQNLIKTRIRQNAAGKIEFIVNQRVVKTLTPSR